MSIARNNVPSRADMDTAMVTPTATVIATEIQINRAPHRAVVGNRVEDNLAEAARARVGRAGPVDTPLARVVSDLAVAGDAKSEFAMLTRGLDLSALLKATWLGPMV